MTTNLLPEDIMIKILLLLSFQSVLECKRVSKEWKNLINHPKFFSLYHDKSLALFVSNGSLFCILIRHQIAVTAAKGCSHPPYTVHRIPIEFDHGCADRLVSESSNAMACVGTTEDQFLFYNLFTGASYTVVDAPIAHLLQLHFRVGWMCYGFGYDRYADDYKIMLVCDYKVGEWLRPAKREKKKIDIMTVQREDNSQFWVYNFKNHAWKPLHGFPYAAYSWHYTAPRACSFNGVLHWNVSSRETEVKKVIVTYDLHNCRFGEILVPTYDNFYWENINELGGKLCYSFHYQNVWHVWVLEEYGVKDSWTKLFSIDKSSIEKSRIIPKNLKNWFPLNYMTLYESREGIKIMFFVDPHNKCLIWYNINKNTTKMVEYDTFWQQKRKIRGYRRKGKNKRV